MIERGWLPLGTIVMRTDYLNDRNTIMPGTRGKVVAGPRVFRTDEVCVLWDLHAKGLTDPDRRKFHYRQFDNALIVIELAVEAAPTLLTAYELRQLEREADLKLLVNYETQLSPRGDRGVGILCKPEVSAAWSRELKRRLAENAAARKLPVQIDHIDEV